MIKSITTLIGLTLVSIRLFSQEQDVVFQAKASKEKLGVNERLRIDFEMNQDGDNFTPPDFEEFRLIGGPNQSVRNTWVNGKSSFSKTYSFFLMPTKTGVFRIKQAKIEIDGKIYKTEPLTIQVTGAVDNPNAPKSGGAVAEENIALELEISESNPYLNEPISAIYKLYVGGEVSVSDFRVMDNPKYNNFWSQNIEITRLVAENTTYKGKDYRYVILKKVVLYPQKVGKLVLEPLSLDVLVSVPTPRVDFFGQRIYSDANVVVSTKSRVINVRGLPPNKPEGFSGAVGSFSLDVAITKKALQALESFQANVKISGRGNLKLFDIPKLDIPSGLEVYEPEKKENVRVNSNGMDGDIWLSYTIVPQYKGIYKIPVLSFSYFDPKEGLYKTLRSNELSINVTEAPNNSSSNSLSRADSQKQYIGGGSSSNFRFIKLTSRLQPTSSSIFFGSGVFYAILLAPFLLIPALIVFTNRTKKNEKFSKSILSKKLARKYLSEAKKNLNDKTQFYLVLEKALHNYLKSKLKIETSEFSKEKIIGLLEAKEVHKEDIAAFMVVFENCEISRYAASSQSSMQQDYDKALDIIGKLDKQF